eukprot:14861-Eustigmatos_ZCMA.PRE.1
MMWCIARTSDSAFWYMQFIYTRHASRDTGSMCISLSVLRPFCDVVPRVLQSSYGLGLLDICAVMLCSLHTATLYKPLCSAAVAVSMFSTHASGSSSRVLSM